MELVCRFKSGIDPEEYKYLHPKIQQMFQFLAHAFDCIGYDLEITSMIRPHTSDSGIHATGRAIDCVPRPANPDFKLDYNNGVRIAGMICNLFRRPNGHVSCIYHDAGSGFHFHLQTDATEGWSDLSGSIPHGP